jgi:hypothetical protein
VRVLGLGFILPIDFYGPPFSSLQRFAPRLPRSVRQSDSCLSRFCSRVKRAPDLRSLHARFFGSARPGVCPFFSFPGSSSAQGARFFLPWVFGRTASSVAWWSVFSLIRLCACVRPGQLRSSIPAPRSGRFLPLVVLFCLLRCLCY